MNTFRYFCCLVSILMLFACSIRQPVRISSLQTQSRPLPGWEAIQRQPAKITHFEILNTGSVKVPLSGMLNSKKLPKDHPIDEFLWVDVYAFLFYHQERGWYLIDTGLDSSFQHKGNISGFLAGKYIHETRQTAGQNIGNQLEKENKSIQGIFFTHLHADHSSGMPEIPHKIPKYVGKNDHYLNIPILYANHHFSGADTLIELDWMYGQELFPFKSVLDVFGDQSLLAIHTPGHSSGHLSYLMFTLDGPILLTGDACHTRYGFEHQIEPGWVDDRKQAEKSLAQLVLYKKLFPDVRVIYGHQGG